MQEYLYNNQVITEADLLAEANKRDVSLKTLMENNKDKIKLKPFSQEELSNTMFKWEGQDVSFNDLNVEATRRGIDVSDLIANNRDGLSSDSRLGETFGLDSHASVNDAAANEFGVDPDVWRLNQEYISGSSIFDTDDFWNDVGRLFIVGGKVGLKKLAELVTPDQPETNQTPAEIDKTTTSWAVQASNNVELAKIMLSDHVSTSTVASAMKIASSPSDWPAGPAGGGGIRIGGMKTMTAVGETQLANETFNNQFFLEYINTPDSKHYDPELEIGSIIKVPVSEIDEEGNWQEHWKKHSRFLNKDNAHVQNAIDKLTRLRGGKKEDIFNRNIKEESILPTINSDGYPFLSDIDKSIVDAFGTEDFKEKAEEAGYKPLLRSDGSLIGWERISTGQKYTSEGLKQENEDEAKDIANRTPEQIIKKEYIKSYFDVLGIISVIMDDPEYYFKEIHDGTTISTWTADADNFAIMQKIIEEGGYRILQGKNGEILKDFSGNAKIANIFNKKLERFKVWNRSLQINADLSLLPEQNILYELASTKDNDAWVDGTINAMDAIGFEMSKDHGAREGGDWGTIYGEDVRGITEGGGEFVRDIIPFVVSLVVTKKVAGSSLARMSKWIKSRSMLANNGNIIRGLTALTVGAVEEVAVTGMADIVGAEMFEPLTGIDYHPLTFDTETGKVTPLFAASLGFANVASRAVIGRVMKNPAFRDGVDKFYRMKWPGSAVGMGPQQFGVGVGATFGAALGTATLTFSEAVVLHAENISETGEFYSVESLAKKYIKNGLTHEAAIKAAEKEWKEHFGLGKTLEVMLGMMILQSLPGQGGNLGTFGKAFLAGRADLARWKGTEASTWQTRASAKRLGVDEDTPAEKIEEVLKKRKAERDKDKTLTNKKRAAADKLDKLDAKELERYKNWLDAIKTAKSQEKTHKWFEGRVGVIGEKLARNEVLTVKEAEFFENLSKWEKKFLTSKLNSNLRGDFTAAIDGYSDLYKSIMREINNYSHIPDAASKLLPLYFKDAKIVNEIARLQKEMIKNPSKAVVNESKIEKLREKHNKNKEKLGELGDFYEDILKTMWKSEMALTKAYASGLGSGFLEIDQDQIRADLYKKYKKEGLSDVEARERSKKEASEEYAKIKYEVEREMTIESIEDQIKFLYKKKQTLKIKAKIKELKKQRTNKKKDSWDKLDEASKKLLKEKAKISDGFFDNRGEGKIIINKESAMASAKIGVGAHELVHRILMNSLKETFRNKDGVLETRISEKGRAVIDNFLKHLKKVNPEAYKKVIDEVDFEYRYKTIEGARGWEYVTKDGQTITFRKANLLTAEKKHELLIERKDWKEGLNYEEYLTVFSTFLRSKKIKFDKKLGDGLATWITPLLRGKGFSSLWKGKKYSKETGKDIFDMLMGLDASFNKMKIDQGILEIADSANLNTGGKIQKSESKKKIDKAILNEITRRVDDLTKNPETGKEYTQQQWRDNIADPHQSVFVKLDKEVTIKIEGSEFTGKLLDPFIKSKKVLYGEDVYGESFEKYWADVRGKLVETIMKYDVSKGYGLHGWLMRHMGWRKGDVLAEYKKLYGDKKTGKEQEGKGEKAAPSGALEVEGKRTKISEKLGEDFPSLIALDAKIHSMIDSGKIKYEGKTFKTLRRVVTLDVAKIFIGEADAVLRYMKDGLSEKAATKKAEKEFVYVDDGTPFWKSKAGKKLLGTSIAKSIEQKILFDSNLNKQDIKHIQMTINKMGPEVFINLVFPQGHNASYKATGVPKKVLEWFYNRSSKKIGNSYPQHKHPNINPKKFLEFVGITERLIPNLYKKDTNTGQSIKAVVDLFERMVLNQAVREKLMADGKVEKAFIASLGEGRSGLAFSENKLRGVVEDLTKERSIEAISKMVMDIKKSIENGTPLPSYLATHPQFTEHIKDLMIGPAFLPAPKYYFGAKLGIRNKDGVLEIWLGSGITDNIQITGKTAKWLGEKLWDPVKNDWSDTGLKWYGKNVSKVLELFPPEMLDVITNTKGNVTGFIVGVKESGKRSITLKNEHIEKALNTKQNPKLAKEIIDLLESKGISLEKIKNARPTLVGVGRIKKAMDVILRAEAEATVKEKLNEFKENHIDDVLKINEGNEHFLRALTEIERYAYEKNGLDIKAPFMWNQMATSIIEGTRANSTLGYFYVIKGKQMAYKTMPIKPDFKKLGFDSWKEYLESSEYREWIKSDWSTATEWAERYKINIKDPKSKSEAEIQGVDRKHIAEIMTIDDLLPANEHAMGNAITSLSRTNYVASNGESAPLGNIGLGHISIIGPKYIARLFDRKLEVGDELVDNKVSYEAELRMTKFLPANKLNNMHHISGEKALPYLIRKNNVVEIVSDIANTSGRELNKLLKDVGLQQSRSSERAKENIRIIDKAIFESRKLDKVKRGMSTFDFDETVGVSENYIFATKGKETRKIASHEWPVVGERLRSEGWKLDFTDFNKVTKGKPGPLMQKLKNQIKKFGNENVFILTARAHESAKAIHEWLKSEGVDIPLENITGLGNSTGEAKAMWMVKKFSEGYNDMYFVDDALSNVKAVKDVLSQLDIKSKVQQAVQESSNKQRLDKEFNIMLEYSRGMGRHKKFSDATAKVVGKKTKYKFIVPTSIMDMRQLIQPLLGKGKKGIENEKWFQKNFLRPYSRGINDVNITKTQVHQDYNGLTNKFKDVKRKLQDEVPGSLHTYENAVRVYLWNKAGFEIPGLSKTELNKLTKAVKGDAELLAFSKELGRVSKAKEGYVSPGNSLDWLVGDIAKDLFSISEKTSREKYLADWIERKNVIFSKDNLNKLEAVFGQNYREALEDILYRMENNTNRNFGDSKEWNMAMDVVNGTVAGVMFFNLSSATGQLISSVHYLNYGDNNAFHAGARFADGKQFWKDFTGIWNSEMLVQRRKGVRFDISVEEITDAIAKSDNQVLGAFRWMLSKGYIPTKYADSFAIAIGGASFYRNRKNTYLKTMNNANAKKKAWEDFVELTEERQQSSRPDFISKQQAGISGRVLLNWANTPIQMFRVQHKEIMDIAAGRFEGYTTGENSLKAKVSKIAYYGVIQSAVFFSLQQAFWAISDSDDEEFVKQKELRVLNGILDSYLKGYGALGQLTTATKNTMMQYIKQNERGHRANHAYTLLEAMSFSPPANVKGRKLYSFTQTMKYKKDIIKERGFSIDNPALLATGKLVSATTNFPLDVVAKKMINLENMVEQDRTFWQRFWLFLGKTPYALGLEDPDIVEAKKKTQKRKKKKSGSGYGVTQPYN